MDFKMNELKDILLTPLKDGERVTEKRKFEAALALATKADRLMVRPEPKDDPWSFMPDNAWQIAELRKYDTVRIIKDKTSKCWILTIYGSVDGVMGYHGLNINTGEMIPQTQAEMLYSSSKGL